MNQELKEQAHKEFEEKKLVTGAMWLVKMWEKNKNNTEIEIELPEHIKDEFRYLIDSLINKTVQMERDRIVEWAKSKKNKLTMKWDMDKAKSTVYDSIIYEWNDYPLITNKSDINKNKEIL